MQADTILYCEPCDDWKLVVPSASSLDQNYHLNYPIEPIDIMRTGGIKKVRSLLGEEHETISRYTRLRCYQQMIHR